MTMKIDLRRVVYVLADALDLVGVDDEAHGKRVAFMAVRAADVLGLTPADKDELLLAGLLHDCGVSSTREHGDLASGLDWDGEDAHCERGAALVLKFRPLAHLAPLIRRHHTHATDLEKLDLTDRHKAMANLIYLADRVDVLAVADGGDVLMARERICGIVRDNLGTRFRVDVGEALLEAALHEEFWLTREPRALSAWIGRQFWDSHPMTLTLDELESLGSMFATIVDAKSPFTASHSHRVAAVARILAVTAGLDEDRARLVGVAALLHDIGKLRVPDAVLDKRGGLDVGERCTMVRHAFDTWQILSRIEGFEEISRWAAFHHECVDGGGHPFGIRGSELALESRIVAVADVFQALRQDRPYRGRMPLEQTMSVIDGMVLTGKLDGELVRILQDSLDECDAAAVADAAG